MTPLPPVYFSLGALLFGFIVVSLSAVAARGLAGHFAEFRAAHARSGGFAVLRASQIGAHQMLLPRTLGGHQTIPPVPDNI